MTTRFNLYSVLGGALAACTLLAMLAAWAPSASAAQCAPIITVDRPTAATTVQGSTIIEGWAVDPTSASGSNSGVQSVLVYRDGELGGGGVLVGEATRHPRADIDATYGLSGAQAGWRLTADFGSVSAGAHPLFVYAMTACGLISSTSTLTVASPPTTEINIDSPTPGQQVAAGSALQIGGWIMDIAGTGTSIDQIHIYADGQAGSGGTVLGTATYGKPRSDVANARGKPDWVNTGFDFTWTVAGLTSGRHTLYVYARSSATGQWTYKTVDIEVTGGTAAPSSPAPAASAAPPAASGTTTVGNTAGTVVKIIAPSEGATATGTVYLRGLAADCNTGEPATSIRVYVGSATGAPIGEAQLQPSRNLLSAVCGEGASGAGAYSWEYIVGGGENPNNGQRSFVVVASFNRGTSSDTVSVNGSPRFGGGNFNNGPYNSPYGGGYGPGNCQVGYVFTNGQCITTQGSSYCQPGYVTQSTGCVFAGNPGGGYGYNNQQCGLGYIFTNGQCLSTQGNNYCPAGTVYQNGRCTY